MKIWKRRTGKGAGLDTCFSPSADQYQCSTSKWDVFCCHELGLMWRGQIHNHDRDLNPDPHDRELNTLPLSYPANNSLGCCSFQLLVIGEKFPLTPEVSSSQAPNIFHFVAIQKNSYPWAILFDAPVLEPQARTSATHSSPSLPIHLMALLKVLHVLAHARSLEWGAVRLVPAIRGLQIRGSINWTINALSSKQ